MLFFFFIVISSILFVKLNEPVDKVYIVVDEDLTRNISSVNWCEMSSKNSYYYINPKHTNNPIISFRIKTVSYNNNKTTDFSDWTSVLYDIDLINICYSNISIIVTASIVIFLGILYAFVLMLNNCYDNWYRCCMMIMRI